MHRFLEPLGAGAMGEVFLAERVATGRREAVKVLRPHVAASPDLVARFRREARVIDRLDHPNIVKLYEFGDLPDGRMFLAMEYVPGPTVGALLRTEGRLGVSRGLAILAQLADALDHAHRQGVVHRDLRPDNVLLADGDVVKVLDFGLAKIVDPGHRDSVATTAEGTVMGTPAYLAPELVGGDPPDARSDLYAFGCLGFELFTGAPPFSGRPMAVLDAHVNQAPARIGDAIPEALDDLIAYCLHKAPAERPTAAAARAVIARAQEGA